MTTPQLVDDLKRDEGLRLTAYPDPLSGGVPWTIGYGHAQGVKPGDVWTQAQADAMLQNDIDAACALLDHNVAWWRKLDGVRQDALANMAFNLGNRVLKFSHMLGALDAHDWVMASEEALDSAWASQTGARAQRIAFMLKTGERMT